MKAKQKHTGLVHIYCGEGKGKTTAAIGLINRAAGHGYRIMLVQFLKDGHSGEIASLHHLCHVKVLAGQVTSKFSIAMTGQEIQASRDLHLRHFHQAVAAAGDGQLDLLVLDEVLGAIEYSMMDESALTAFLDSKPETLEVVLTGRRASDALLSRADYISRIECVRHPYQRGILAREGIEY